LTFNGTTLTANTLNLTNALGTAYGGTGLTSFTTNGVVYASSTSALATGSALTFDGTNFATTGTATAAKLIPTGSSATGNGMYLPATNALGFSTAGAERARIDSSGNLGVGVTPSASSACTNIELPYGATLSARNNFGPQFAMMSNAVGNWYAPTYKVNGYATQYTQQGFDGTHAWYNAPSGTAGNAITFTQAMTLDASGNLLVGTTSSTTYTGNSVIVAQGGASPGGSNISVNHISGSSSGNYYLGFNYAGTGIGSITQSGTTAVLFNVTSDQRLKENIQDAESASALIDSLQVRQFDWKTDNTHQRYGFVAQELVTVVPEAVHQPADSDEMMAVDYSKLVPMLVKEIQSLRKRLTALEST